MENSRLPKILLYGQIGNAPRPEGRPLLRYKDKIKANLSSLKVPLTNWEQLAQNRSEWRGLCNQHVTNFEIERKEKMVRAREERKGLSRPEPGNSLFTCDVCQKICKSNAGLSSHKRSQHSSHVNQATSNSNEDHRSVCQICGKVCKNERGLKIHSRVHGQ